MIGNLRGIRESGRIFAIPTYFFIVTTLVLVGLGTWQVLSGNVQPLSGADVDPVTSTIQPLTLFLLLRAFANGCTAMTGVEAVSNGVPAFRPPESKNAASTMLIMAVLSITMFWGLRSIAGTMSCRASKKRHLWPARYSAEACRITRAPQRWRSWCWQRTRLTLIPRLASILARDAAPRRFMNQGDRLAFSNGIVGLSLFAAILLVAFGGDTHALIPLYMIGVFVSFTPPRPVWWSIAESRTSADEEPAPRSTGSVRWSRHRARHRRRHEDVRRSVDH
jgi:amino acid transporter